MEKINRGSNLASSFEMIYGRSPRLYGVDNISRMALPTVEDHKTHVARRLIDAILRLNARDPEKARVGDEVYIWRDD